MDKISETFFFQKWILWCAGYRSRTYQQ